jgi:hypothetical protein
MHIVRRLCVLTIFIAALLLLGVAVTLEVLCGKRPAIMMACEHMSNIKIWPHPNHTVTVAPFRIFFDGVCVSFMHRDMCASCVDTYTHL